MTAPDQYCINVKKLLSIRRRPHMTQSGHGAANFAVMHNATFLIRAKASFITSSTAKSLPSGSSKWLVMASAIPMKRARAFSFQQSPNAEFLYCSWF
jgi:hypothetical protein